MHTGLTRTMLPLAKSLLLSVTFLAGAVFVGRGDVFVSPGTNFGVGRPLWQDPCDRDDLAPNQPTRLVSPCSSCRN